MDTNGDARLQPEEKHAAPNRLGFDYFEFHRDGTCRRDSDLKFRGRFEVLEENQTSYLLIHTDPPGETYRYRLESGSDDELVLYSDGVFLVFNKR